MKNAVKPERKLWQDLKKNTCSIYWNRIENLSLLGMPDVLGYNTSGHFFTVELKVAKGNKVRFSPHQISFHKSHPKNTFILLRTLGPRALKLVPGNKIQELLSMGHEPWTSTDWIEIQKTFELVAWGLELEAWSLELGAWRLALGACCLALGPWILNHELVRVWLVLPIGHPGYIPVPACSTISAAVALLRRRTGRVVLRGHAGCEWPVLDWALLINHMIRYYNF